MREAFPHLAVQAEFLLFCLSLAPTSRKDAPCRWERVSLTKKAQVAQDPEDEDEAFHPLPTHRTRKDRADNKTVKACPFRVSACPDTSSLQCSWASQANKRTQRYSHLPLAPLHCSQLSEDVIDCVLHQHAKPIQRL